ncbi:MAG TPA: HAMP domain-containing sensor histidine kinase, partial [Gemmatimonadaceae bacterium]
WNANHARGAPAAINSEEARAILGDAERLDAYLSTVSDSLRTHAQRLERLDFVASTILAPMALVAMLIVLWAGVQLLRFARAVDTERAEVIRSTEARAALLRGVTHDVKNPLGAVAGFAQLLEEGVVGPLSSPQLDMIKRMRRLVKSAVDIVTDLLEVARDDGAAHVDLAETDLGPLTQEVVADHSGMAREYGVDVNIAAPSTVVRTDPNHVRRILANLVSNAIKYTPKGGHVGIRVKTGRLGVQAAVGIEVADNGPGIAPELRDRVFDEFFRVNGDNVHTSGNGLGLAISRRLARMLGGDIVLEDNTGGGSVFTLWLQARAERENRVSSATRVTA